MLPKKSQKAELESKRPLFFLTGVSIAIIVVIVAFQWTSIKTIELPNNIDPVEVVSINVPRTVRNAPEKPEPIKTETNKDMINIVDDLFINQKMDIPDIFDNSDDPEAGLIDIVFEGGDDPIETIPFILVEKVAMPSSCHHLTDRDDQIACLNEWISSYILKETNFPEQAVRMGLIDKVYVNFVVSEKGVLENVKIARGEYDVLNEEALRVIRNMPKLMPASQKNKPVKMSMTVPINFKY